VLHDANVVRTAVARDAQLVFALEKRLVDGPVAFGLALQHVVADALAPEILDVLLRFFEIRRERPFLENRAVVFVLDRLQRLDGFGVQLTLGISELRVDLDDVRMFVAVPFRQLRLLALQLAELRLEQLHLRVLRHRRQ